MKKGMVMPSWNNTAYKMKIRKHYFAMIAEYDSMVGEVLRAVEEAGVMNNT